MRQSLATLESFIVRTGTALPQSSASSNPHRHGSSSEPPEKPLTDGDEPPSKSVPGMLGQEGHGGLYAGPTSMVTHLLSFKSSDQREDKDIDNGDGSTRSSDEGPPPLLHDQSRTYDNDLLDMLPQLHIIDGECPASCHNLY